MYTGIWNNLKNPENMSIWLILNKQKVATSCFRHHLMILTKPKKAKTKAVLYRAYIYGLKYCVKYGKNILTLM